MMIRNTKIEKRQKFEEEILFPQLKGNGLGIGNYINQLEHRIDTLATFLQFQKDEIDKSKTNNMTKIVQKGDYFSTIEVEIETNLLRCSERLVSEWNSNHSYDDRIDLSDVFQYVFEKSDLNGGEEYILEHFKKNINE